MARLLHASHLLCVALLLLLYAERANADVSCTAGVFSSGTQEQITCNFGKNIGETRPRPNFNVMMYKFDDLQGDGVHVLLCNWNGDALPCNVKGDYSFNGTVTDRLVVNIPRVEKSMEGLYVCQLVPSGDDTVHTCQLNVTEGAPIPPHSVTTSTTTTITPMPTSKTFDGEEGAVSNDKTGVTIAVVVPIVLLLMVGVCCVPWLKFVKKGRQETRNNNERHSVDWTRYILFCRLVRSPKKRQTGEGSPVEAGNARASEENETLINIDITNAQEAFPGKGDTKKLIANRNADDTMCKSEKPSSCVEVNEVEGDRKDVGENVDVNVSGGVVGYKGEGKGDKLTPPTLTPRKHTNVTVNVSQVSHEPEPRQSLNQHATESGELTTKEEVILGNNDGRYVKKVKERVDAHGDGTKSTTEQHLRQMTSQPDSNTTGEDVVRDNTPLTPTDEALINVKADKPLSNTNTDESNSNTENSNSRIEKNDDEVDNRANVRGELDVKGGEGKVNNTLKPESLSPTTNAHALQESLEPGRGQNTTQSGVLTTQTGERSTQAGAQTTQKDVIPASKPLTKPHKYPMPDTHVAATDTSEASLELERNPERSKLQLELQQARERRLQFEHQQQLEHERKLERQQQLKRARQQQLEMKVDTKVQAEQPAVKGLEINRERDETNEENQSENEPSDDDSSSGTEQTEGEDETDKYPLKKKGRTHNKRWEKGKHDERLFHAYRKASAADDDDDDNVLVNTYEETPEQHQQIIQIYGECKNCRLKIKNDESQ